MQWFQNLSRFVEFISHKVNQGEIVAAAKGFDVFYAKHFDVIFYQPEKGGNNVKGLECGRYLETPRLCIEFAPFKLKR
jgi:hypothetical protein